MNEEVPMFFLSIATNADSLAAGCCLQVSDVMNSRQVELNHDLAVNRERSVRTKREAQGDFVWNHSLF
ncbi:hypothetical protein O9993_22995 [Vibrio lentus]|nr:hypothetical protein [Vibrio lentus]